MTKDNLIEELLGENMNEDMHVSIVGVINASKTCVATVMNLTTNVRVTDSSCAIRNSYTTCKHCITTLHIVSL